MKRCEWGVACLVSTLECPHWTAQLGSGRAWKLAVMLPVAFLHALQSWLAEEECRVFTASLPEEYQPGAPASAATSRGAAGATAAAADLPAPEVQQQHQHLHQHQHQQERQQCGGARDAGSTDGAPITPTGQAAVLPQQQEHGSSDQEQEQWDAAGERCLHIQKAQ